MKKIPTFEQRGCYAISMALLLTCAVSMSAQGAKPQAPQQQAVQKSQPVKKKLTKDEIALAKATFVVLRGIFKFNSDEFNGSRSYADISSEAMQAGVGEGIIAIILESKLTCFSFYNGYSRLSHSGFQVKIGDKIKTVSGGNVTKLKDTVYNEVCLLSPELSIDIARFIANNPYQKTRIRLNSNNGNKDFTLDPFFCAGILRTIKLYDALQVLKQADIDPESKSSGLDILTSAVFLVGDGNADRDAELSKKIIETKKNVNELMKKRNEALKTGDYDNINLLDGEIENGYKMEWDMTLKRIQLLKLAYYQQQ